MARSKPSLPETIYQLALLLSQNDQLDYAMLETHHEFEEIGFPNSQRVFTGWINGKFTFRMHKPVDRKDGG